MAWQEELVPMLRYIIDDIAEDTQDEVYSDDRLEQTLVISAQLVLFDVHFPTTYSVDINATIISPDPTDPRDNAFITLVVLKASCIIVQAEIKSAADDSVKITDGPSTIDNSGGVIFSQKRRDQICEQYGRARLQYLAGNARGCAAILGPYVNESVSPLPWNF